MAGQPRCRPWQRYGRLAVTVVLSLCGLTLICIGRGNPKAPARPLTSRQVIIVPSARGLSVVGRQWRRYEEQEALQAEFAVAEPAGETPVRGRPLALMISDQPASEPTAIPPRTEVITYTVQRGDNVYLIAQRFGVSQDTIIWANGDLEMDPDLLSIGQELAVLPVSGVWHKVKEGETLQSIAKRYQVAPEVISNYAPNHLQESAELTPGQMLIVPGGIKPFEPRIVYTEGGAVTVNARPEAGRFIWPCTGAITQYFSKTHLAIDIGNVTGTPVYAAAAGTVTLAGWAGGLGNAVRIDHGNGYVTTYGHFSQILVAKGDWVARGQKIGLMGSTGMSTGPHVHFVISLYGGAVNPIRYLPH